MKLAATSVIVGASRGLGAALLSSLSAAEPGWVGVSRARPQNRTNDWIEADVSTADGCDALAHELSGKPIGCLIYCAGAWESVDLGEVGSADIFQIVGTNLSGFIALCARLRSELIAGSAIVVAIGSTSGMENAGTSAVAYAASKFGLRGATQSLREWFRGTSVRVTCLSLGSLADGASASGSRKIPYADVVSVIGMFRQLSPYTIPKELHLPAVDDKGA